MRNQKFAYPEEEDGLLEEEEEDGTTCKVIYQSTMVSRNLPDRYQNCNTNQILTLGGCHK